MIISDLPFGIYTINARTITNCGPGPFSEPLVIQHQFVPAAMEPLTSVVEGCNLKFSWEASIDGGLPIIGYRLEVQAFNNGEFYEVEACQSGAGQLSCNVEEKSLLSNPFGLRRGD
jgi:hypothetical protein